MATSEWKSWKRADWNAVLVDAVFVSRPGLSPLISRIESTNNFLARVVGAPVSQGERVRKDFIECFKGTPWQVRQLFDYGTQTSRWSPERPDLPFFAQLYLTILVASADADTHELGNFRERLTKSLGLYKDPVFNLKDLGSLWQAAAQWTKKSKRAELRRLELPDPGYETIIGYSKRLAFPAYRDQLRLAEILTRESLDSDSPVDSIVHALDRHHGKFSEWFHEEYRAFIRHIHNGDHESAVKSPLWAAIADISWEKHRSETKKVGAAFQLELDVVDPYDGSVELLCDQPLKSGLWTCHKAAYTYGKFGYRVAPREGAVLDRLGATDSQRLLARDLLLKDFRDGLIIFGADEFGRWVNSRNIPDGENAWLLVDKRHSKDARRALDSARLRPPYFAGIPQASWYLVGPFEWSEDLRYALAKAMPVSDALRLRLRLPNIRFRGGLRLPEGYLLLEPVLPRVALTGALAIHWTAHCGDERLGPFVTSQDPDTGEFVIHAGDVASVKQPALLQFIARDASNDAIAEAKTECVRSCRSSDLKRLKDLNRWYVTGNAGQLVPASGQLLPVQDAPQAISDSAAIRPILLSKSEQASGAKSIPFSELPVAWRDALEILAATYIRSQGVSQQDFFELVQHLWGLDVRHTWIRIEDLVQNQIVRCLFSRRWHGSFYVANPPSLLATANQGRWRVRLLGLAHDVVRQRVVNACSKFGSRPVLLTSPDAAVIGPAEVWLDKREHVLAVADAAHLPVEMVDLPKLSALPSWREILRAAPESPKGERTVWSQSAQAFLEAEPRSIGRLSLERWRAQGVQDLYVVKASDLTWTTRSRTWALLAHAALSGGIGLLSGRVLSVQRYLALPPIVSAAAVQYGSGVCFANAAGRRVYAGGDLWNPLETVSHWIARFSRSKPEPSFTRLDLALRARTGIKGISWYGGRIARS